MTEDQKKEALSRQFLKVLAHSHGFKVIEPPQDHGVDMIVNPVTVRREPNGNLRYLDSQYKLDFQLKSTTLNGIVDADDHVKFDLEVKNYNDLVYRKDDPLPLHLFIVVFNSAPPTCVTIHQDQLSMLGNAYWYLPGDDSVISENKNQVRITIPKANRVGFNFVHERFEELGIEL